MMFPFVGWNEQWKMDTGRITCQYGCFLRSEAVESKHLDLLVYSEPQNQRPFVLQDRVAGGHRRSRYNRV